MLSRQSMKIMTFEELSPLNDGRVVSLQIELPTDSGCSSTLRVYAINDCGRPEWDNRLVRVTFEGIVMSVSYLGGRVVPPYYFDWANSLTDEVFQDRWNVLEWDMVRNPLIIGGFGFTSGDYCYFACRNIKLMTEEKSDSS